MINGFIKELEEREIILTFSAGKLKYSGPEENITTELLQTLKLHKGKLIRYFWPKDLGNLMPINPEGNKHPIFLIHGDNGNYLLSRYLGQDQPVYGFFHPGSEGEGIKFKSVREISTSYLEKIRKVSPEGPYYIAGFSFGGVVAFDIAMQLQQSGQKVPFLVLIDSISPLAKEPFKWHNNLYRIIRSNILRTIKLELIRFTKIAICNGYILVNKPIPVERRNFYMLDKYRKLNSKYNPGKFDGKILLFRTSANPTSNKFLGWESLVAGIKYISLPADHTTVFDNEKSAELLKIEFARYLSEVTTKKINGHEVLRLSI